MKKRFSVSYSIQSMNASGRYKRIGGCGGGGAASLKEGLDWLIPRLSYLGNVKVTETEPDVFDVEVTDADGEIAAVGSVMDSDKAFERHLKEMSRIQEQDRQYALQREAAEAARA